ncbi:MAG: HIT family protein [Polynucleobacter sp.]|nr:HIT family protein [Polynucleobacter sp.]MDZ4057347.1 HIT family protein [Polynucleobacter sp.]
MTNCILCAEEGGEVVWRGDDCRVVLVQDADLPGFCRVIWNRHVGEMTQLSYGERELLMTLVFALESVIRQVMQPTKINLAALGNQVPHIHWHIIPRYEDDAFFPGSPWSARVRETASSVLRDRRQQAMELPQAIRAAIAGLS